MSHTKIIDLPVNPSDIPIAELLENLPTEVTHIALADLLASISTQTANIELAEVPASESADALDGGMQTVITNAATTAPITTAPTSSSVPSSSTSRPYTVYSSTRPLLSSTPFPSLSTPIPISVPSPSALPPFFDGDVSLWFCTLEACFLPSDDAQTRFRSVISKLPPSILAKVRHVFPIT